MQNPAPAIMKFLPLSPVSGPRRLVPAAAGGQARDVVVIGAGLAGLSERVRLDGGSLEYGPEEGRFRLVVVLPWPEEGADAPRRNDHRKVP